ncbi:hypothetical protein [Chroococcidiopsis sp.]|uniref:hypothetical protein n=1 Tax=Chroococcidiopsis sp. TaxID=3088168 RepID=UPI003F396D69
MKTYTIYAHPRDYPNHFVMRVFKIKPNVAPIPTGAVAIAPTLEEIRMSIPIECVRIERDERDDPVIIETWI